MSNTHKNIIAAANLIGQTEHRNFIELQAAFVIAQRGGSGLPGFSKHHVKRISRNANLLNSAELKSLIFGENNFNN